MAVAGIPVGLLVDLLTVFVVAAAVGILVAKVVDFPYTIALLLAGFAGSLPVIGLAESIDLQLSHDLILLVLLPPLLFEGAATTDLERFRRNALPILTVAVVGLLVSVALLGVASGVVLGLQPLVALLFAAMILPTDPVSVLALFEELGAPERLSVLVEGESLVNDGVGVVLFTTLLVPVSAGESVDAILQPAELAALGTEIAVVSLGGAVVGFAAGYAVYSVMVNLDERMTEIVLTIILAYGSFLLAEHYLHLSGVIATVVAGLFIGNRGAEYAMSPRTKISIFTTWETGAFIVNTFIFLLIGVKTPIGDLLANADLIALAIVLVVAARAAVVYPLTAITNRFSEPSVPLSYQHVVVWGGLHASIPIALVLGLPTEGLLTPEVRTQLRALVFGVAAFSLVVQGLTMGRLIDSLGIVTRSEAEELLELLVGRSRAVNAALDAAEALHDGGEIPTSVYRDFTAEYEREKGDLDTSIAELLEENPRLRREQLLTGERQVLQRERSAVIETIRAGVVSDEIGERLLDELSLKLDRVRGGESTVEGEEEGYEEFWRGRARAFGLSAVEETPASGDDD